MWRFRHFKWVMQLSQATMGARRVIRTMRNTSWPDNLTSYAGNAVNPRMGRGDVTGAAGACVRTVITEIWIDECDVCHACGEDEDEVSETSAT